MVGQLSRLRHALQGVLRARIDARGVSFSTNWLGTGVLMAALCLKNPCCPPAPRARDRASCAGAYRQPQTPFWQRYWMRIYRTTASAQYYSYKKMPLLSPLLLCIGAHALQGPLAHRPRLAARHPWASSPDGPTRLKRQPIRLNSSVACLSLSGRRPLWSSHMFEPCSVSGWHSRGSRGASGHLPASLFSIVPASACDALHAARSPSNCAEMRILFVRRYLH